MKAYPAVSSLNRVARAPFLNAVFMLLLIAGTLSAYSNELVNPAMVPGKPTPVKLKSFNATKKNAGSASLSWTTEQEINVSHFVVERSYDGKRFDEAGLVFTFDNSTGSNAYRFTDDRKKKHAGVIYYRLRIVDMDGKTENSVVSKLP